MMQPLTQKDLWPNPIYEGVRDQFRREVILAKKDRRVSVGPWMTLIFENRLTVKFQVQEILRIEKISKPELVQEELDGFNAMLPIPGELSATLLIEFTGPDAEVAAELRKLSGLGRHVWLEIGGRRVGAILESGRDDGTRISAVQYIRFPVGAEAAAQLEDATVASELVVDHPSYHHRAALSESMCRSLAQDLRAPAASR
jgi:Protein of unknown function (DUF3501)